GSGGTSANVRFDTQSTTGFRAAASGTGAAFTQVNGDVFDNALNRFETTGGLLRILADLDTGVWTASANDGESGTYKTIVSGSGLLDIANIRFNSLSPSTGSWGGAGAGQATDPTVGGTAGDFVRIDSLTLTAVPEPSVYSLLAGALALTSVMVRRRKA
ncbi:MAG: PEP-CTERM sorting domain-containing protein, partial [Puniceicoccaceae bacterium]|nr:PEP-CTERM sorting domain-containing protein [Puniceicoccaceae bacterium]